MVAFNIGGNSDMIDHKLNGYLAKAKDTEDLAKGVDYCLTNNVENRLSDIARAKVIENFKLSVIGKSYVELYDQIAAYFHLI